MEHTLTTAGAPTKTWIRTVAWVAFFAFCLLFFSILKLPQDRIHRFVMSTAGQSLAPMGVTLTAETGEISLWLGPRYIFKKVTISREGSKPIQFDVVKLRPNLLPLVLGKLGGSLVGKINSSEILVSASQGKTLDLNLKLSDWDLGRSGMLSFLTGIAAYGFADGTIDITGDLASPSTLEGKVELALRKIEIPSQKIMGFQLPTILVSEGVLNAKISGGKLSLTEVRIGKPGKSSDDLSLQASGDVTLGKTPDQSLFNVKTRIKVSDKVLQAFPLLDSLLGAAKQTDGSYVYDISGTPGMPNFQPSK